MSEEYWTDKDGHDDNYVGEMTGEICSECGAEMMFFQTGVIPPTQYEPGEVMGYFQCSNCGEVFSL